MLEELDKLLEASVDVELNTGDFEPIVDGTYNAVIESVGFCESKSGNYMFKWEFIIQDKPYVNRHEWKYTVLNKPENMKRLTTDLEKFGINTSSMKTIQNSLENLLDVPVIVDIKTTPAKDAGKDPFRNISIKPAR